MNNVNYEIHPHAQAEYEDYLRFYAARGFTMATLEDFREEIETAFKSIATNPLTYRLVTKRGKRRRFGPTKRFKFIIYYTVKATALYPTSSPSRIRADGLIIGPTEADDPA
jgi:plasmid stabilization system protein ParE